MYVVYHKDSTVAVKQFVAKFAAERLADKLNVGEGYYAYECADDLQYRRRRAEHREEFA